MRRRLQGKQRPPQTAWWLDAAPKVTEGEAPKKKSVHLVTISRQRVHYTASGHPVVEPSNFPRQQIRDAILAACANPEYTPVARARRPN